MFTNWLTTPTTKSTSTTPSPCTLSNNGINSGGGGGGGVQHPPPDIIIEVGPPPFTQFAAHSTLLIAHSGYIRAILHREDGNPSCTSETPVYVPNITSEQFAPLLTYMYTGFLDLTIENIFGVLLATHILHMPRALEICRQYLARSQTENYFNGFLGTPPAIIPPSILPTSSTTLNNQTVIRPIPNKATIGQSGLAFITPPSIQAPHTLKPSQHTNFQKISSKDLPEPIPSTSTCSKSYTNEKKRFKKSVKNTPPPLVQPTTASTSSPPVQSPILSAPTVSTMKQHPHKNETECNTVQPPEHSSKIIIDVASCDGPVRFRRVLNEAYGRSAVSSNQHQLLNYIDEKQRNMKSVLQQTHNQQQHHTININSSFHQQMARNISERRQQHVNSEESENSEDTIAGHSHHHHSHNSATMSVTKDEGIEIYVCVYCKHTFKSQYCYQKHAKRHLNPLAIDNNSSSDAVVDVDMDDDEILNMSENVIEKNDVGGGGGGILASIVKDVSPMVVVQPSTIQTVANLSNKREVRPLDMNVQYYPCKTCGCKFPSYYFVHKHRKLCHADEEN